MQYRGGIYKGPRRTLPEGKVANINTVDRLIHQNQCWRQTLNETMFRLLAIQILIIRVIIYWFSKDGWLTQRFLVTSMNMAYIIEFEDCYPKFPPRHSPGRHIFVLYQKGNRFRGHGWGLSLMCWQP
ncbi:hypothetical protein MKX01_020640 [Papaver californicum]|nr:hypothetical protein MKX01_020640 [Papaver californicum]